MELSRFARKNPNSKTLAYNFKAIRSRVAKGLFLFPSLSNKFGPLYNEKAVHLSMNGFKLRGR